MPMIPLINPRRPPKKWFDSTVRELKKDPDITDPQAVAGWIWHHHAKPGTKKKILRAAGEYRAARKVRKNSRSSVQAGRRIFTQTEEATMPFVTRRRPAMRRIKRRRSRVNAWYNDARGHAKAARLGWKRRKTSRRRRKNPGLAYMPIGMRANPRRKRRNLGARGVRYPSLLRGNPVMRRRRRRPRSNQAMNLRNILSRRNLTLMAKTGIGVAAGFTALPLAYNFLPANVKTEANRRWLGAIPLGIGVLLMSMVRNRDVKDVGLIVMGFGAYDLLAANLPIGLPVLPTEIPLVSRYVPALSEQTSASYQVPVRPISPVARTGYLGASYEAPARAGYGASYEAPGMRTEGVAGMLGSDNPFAEIAGYQM